MPTDLCNLNCIYCFHATKINNQSQMDLETLNHIYKAIFSSYDKVKFIWHGGEPLIMGVDFLTKAIEMQFDYPMATIRNSIQTNLTLVSDKFIEFAKNYKIGIGGSYDGIRNEDTRGYSSDIMKSSKRLIDNDIQHGFIMVVSKINIDTLISSYIFFKERKQNFTINLYVADGHEKSANLELEPTYSSKKIIELFDYWLFDNDSNIEISYFMRFVKFIFTGEKAICTYNSCLGKFLAIRFNGDIVPCNRMFPDYYSYGNVHQYTDITEAFQSEGFYRLLEDSIVRREKCKGCEIYSMCTGGCNNQALMGGDIRNPSKNSCELLYNVYIHIDKTMREIIKEESKIKKLNVPLMNYILAITNNRTRVQC